MNEVLAATLGGLAALVFWGVSDWLISRNSKKFSGIEVNLALHIIGAAILSVVYLLSGHGLPDSEQFLIIVLSAGFFSAGFVFFIKALSIGQSGVVVPLVNIFPLFTLLATFIFLTITFSGLQISAMLIVVVGAVLVGMEKLNWRSLHKNLNKEVLLATASAWFFGIGVFFLNFVVDKLPWETVAALSALASLVYILLYALARNRQTTITALRTLHKNKIGIAAGATVTLGDIGFFAGAELSGNLIIPAVISSASVLVTSLLARVFDNEKLIIAKRIGAVLVVTGVVLLNIN